MIPDCLMPPRPVAAEVAPRKTLIVVPTYNEAENAPVMCREIQKLGLSADVLFVDDNSPDGTGRILEELKAGQPRLIVQHREGKLGIGSAHRDAIRWAYEQGFETVVTLDCDFSHSPADIPAMIRAVEAADVSVGSRWTRRGSLPGWSLLRRCMTLGGHLLTTFVLGMPHDASGAFRAYRLDRLPREVFDLVRSRGYSFFLESLFIIHVNRFTIVEVPLILPARASGDSKMSLSDAVRSASRVFELAWHDWRHPSRFRLETVRGVRRP